jgi:hypothetical protein
MARRKAWTAKKRQRAARQGAVTRKKRRQIIEQARQSQETGYALLIPFGAWLQNTIKLKQRVEHTVSLSKGDRCPFSVPDIVAGMVVAFQTGVVRSKHLSRLVPEVKLAESVGLPHFFGATTASDLMKQAHPRHIQEMQRVLRGISLEAVEHDPGPEIDIVADTTGHPSDSRQREGVRVGYCNGRKEPCLKSGRVVINGRPAFATLYPGNENPQEPYEKGVALARRLCRRYPDRRVHLGLDTAFVSERHLRQLHRLAHRYKNFRFTISLPVPDPRSQPAHTVALATAKPKKTWKQVNHRSRVIDMGWRKVYSDSVHRTRVVVVETKNDPPPPAQPTRKKNTKKKRRRRQRPPQRHYLIATNYSQSELKAKAVFRRHHRRPVVEFSFKDAKQSYRINHLPHQKFLANSFYLLVVTLAQLLGILYNQMLLTRQTAGSLVATVRADLWALPGRLVNTTQIVLNLVYHRYRWVRRACVSVKIRLGFVIVFTPLDSS